jgi:nucleoside-diphosphate-sugar epimerase
VIDMISYAVDDERFRGATGWTCRTSLDEGIARTLEFFLSPGDARSAVAVALERTS